ncbi:CDGSH iron-sulfur domain-containing protein [Xenophilus azovorans]|jgi:CDGSH-type Zn-finger protein|uniref:CDGSH iron-sulfur domain-containing protein n=1 Tax=Xenophilus azovorans TaxID=151755 RepID=UPI00068AFE04
MKVKARLIDDGPLVLSGDTVLIDGAGAPYPPAPVVSICRCGLSDKKPFCDGSHRVRRFSHQARAPRLDENS